MRPGRKPLGDRAMTDAERQRRRYARLKAERASKLRADSAEQLKVRVDNVEPLKARIRELEAKLKEREAEVIFRQ